MHIQSIHHTLRGLNFDQALTNKVIITGPSASGKTSIMDAIALALTGSIPRLGSSGAKLEPVINGLDAMASINLSDGSTSRAFRITKGAKGQISKKSSNKEPLSPIIIDPSLFTGAKPADRIAMIQSAVGFKGNLIEAIIKAMDQECPGIQRQLFSKSKDPGEWIAETTELLATEVKEQANIVDRLSSTIQTAAIEESSSQSDYDHKAHEQATASHHQALIKLGCLDAEIRDIDHILQFGEPVKPDKDRSTEITDAAKHLAELRAKKSDLCRRMTVAESNGKKIEGWESQLKGFCFACGAHHEHWSSIAQEARANELEAVKGYIAEAQKLIADCPTDSDHDNIEFEIMEAEQEARLENDWAHYNYAKEAHEKARSSLAEKEGARLGLTKVIETLETEIAIYKQQESAYAAIQAEIATSGRRKQDLDQATQRSTTAKSAIKALKVEVSNQSNKLMGPILKIANTITKGILPAPVEASNFALGYSREGAWVPLDGFSGAETAVALSSIQAALLSADDIKTIIVDEAQKLDPTMFDKFLANLGKSIEKGDIEQAIIIGSSLQDRIPTGWQSIILTK
jgi:DNA repair exonuclease SbcCD ATPase subunit